jgi:hypothetical protein
MIGISCLDQRHHHRHDRIVVRTALAIKSDERPTPADCAMHLRIRVRQAGCVWSFSSEHRNQWRDHGKTK